MKSYKSSKEEAEMYLFLSTHTYKERGSVIMCDHSDTGVVWPQAEECWQPPWGEREQA